MGTILVLMPIMVLATAVAVAPLAWAVRRRPAWDREEHARRTVPTAGVVRAGPVPAVPRPRADTGSHTLCDPGADEVLVAA